MDQVVVAALVDPHAHVVAALERSRPSTPFGGGRRVLLRPSLISDCGTMMTTSRPLTCRPARTRPSARASRCCPWRRVSLRRPSGAPGRCRPAAPCRRPSRAFGMCTVPSAIAASGALGASVRVRLRLRRGVAGLRRCRRRPSSAAASAPASRLPPACSAGAGAVFGAAAAAAARAQRPADGQRPCQGPCNHELLHLCLQADSRGWSRPVV